MGCLFSSILEMTNSRFCNIWAGMNHFEGHLMVFRITKSRLQRKTNVIRMAIQLNYLDEEKTKCGCNAVNFRRFLFGVTPGN